jgi:hypothetical protein
MISLTAPLSPPEAGQPEGTGKNIETCEVGKISQVLSKFYL